MNIRNFDRLCALIRSERNQLLSSWREQVRKLPSARHLDIPALNDHMPALLDELATAFQLAHDRSIPTVLLEGSPPVHGTQRQEAGFDIAEVVAEYNILRGCVFELIDTHRLELQGKAFHTLNRVFDEAIGIAVQTFATQQALEVQRRREEYLAFVAHDLRTPLNAISLAARVLEKKVPSSGPSSDVSRMLKSLYRNVRQLQTLADTVLKEAAHIQSEFRIKLERRAIDLWPLIESLIYDLSPVAETAGATLRSSVDDELTVFADAGVLRRIFQNLIANSVKYAPRGDIEIGAQRNDAASFVECWVADNGAGIPADRLDSIFEKFETDPDSSGGTGLGLAIVKTFVEAHGGTVTVQSTEGVGSVFRFTLPDPRAAAP